MKWLLVWWIIAPGHSQTVHYRDFDSEQACITYVAQAVPTNKPVRWHCSIN